MFNINGIIPRNLSMNPNARVRPGKNWPKPEHAKNVNRVPLLEREH